MRRYSRIVVTFLHDSVEQEAIGNNSESGGDEQHHVEVERLAEDDVYGTELEPDVYDALDEADDMLHHLHHGYGLGAPLEAPAAEVGGHSAGDHVAATSHAHAIIICTLSGPLLFAENCTLKSGERVDAFLSGALTSLRA